MVHHWAMTDATPYPQAPYPQAPYQPVPAAPGKVLGIVALIVTFFFSVLGAILGIVALVQSRGAGVKNGPAVAAIILGILFTLSWVVAFAVFFGTAFGTCSELGNGVHEVNGVTWTCNV
jgi:hypothetical protein